MIAGFQAASSDRSVVAVVFTGAGVSTDPLLGPLQDNGGPTQSMAPLDGSPLIDAGSNALVTLTVDGPNVGMLLPTETHALALVVPGGSPIPALPHPTTTPKLVFKFDRASLVGAIRAGLATGAIDPAQPLVVWLYDGNRPLGSDAIRIIP